MVFHFCRTFFGLVLGGWLFRVWLFMILSEESDNMLSSFLPHALDMENGHPDLSQNDRHEEKIKWYLFFVQKDFHHFTGCFGYGGSGTEDSRYACFV